ncbi:MAG: thiamine pyrophosphate-dependent enzyme, partial [Acidimicrobiales bacterium]
WPVDGMDVRAVEQAARQAVEGIRAGRGPCFLELRTYRFRAHSLYDPERYRDKAEVERWKERDPITVLSEVLRREGLLVDGDLDAIESEVAAEVDDAVAFARAGTMEPIDQLERFVVSERGEP